MAKPPPDKLNIIPTEAAPLVAVIGVGFVGTGLVDLLSSK
jgi:hypothetical protein